MSFRGIRTQVLEIGSPPCIHQYSGSTVYSRIISFLRLPWPRGQTKDLLFFVFVSSLQSSASDHSATAPPNNNDTFVGTNRVAQQQRNLIIREFDGGSFWVLEVALWLLCENFFSHSFLVESKNADLFSKFDAK